MTGFFLLAGAALLLVAGAELFAEHAHAAGRRLGVTALAVGLILAGAEPEELITAVIASLRDRPGIAVGDAVGASVTMLTLVLGLAALARPLPFGPRVRTYATGAAGAALAAALLLAGGLSRLQGGLLVGLYVVLVGVVWWRERRPPAIGEATEIDEDRRSVSTTLALVLVVVGIAVMALGGRLAVSGAERVVESLDQTDTAIGLTLVALATTAELFALVWAAARRGVQELAVAGVLGSAAYNATATLGTAALVRPIPPQDIALASWAAVLLPLVLIIASRRGQVPRLVGVGLLATYAAYVAITLA